MLKRALPGIAILAFGVLPGQVMAQCVFSNLPCPPTPPGTPVYGSGGAGCDSACRAAGQQARADRRAANQAHYDADVTQDKELRSQGNQAYVNGDFLGAISAYQSALRFDLASHYARFDTSALQAALDNAKAGYAANQGDFEGAIRLFEAGLKFRDDQSIRDWIVKTQAVLAGRRNVAADAAARERIAGQIPAQIAAIQARLQPALDKANARIAAANANANHRLEAMGSAANADFQRELAMHPLRGVNALPAPASAELVSIARSGQSALDAPAPSELAITADPCPVGREGCMEVGKLHAGEGFDTPGQSASPLRINRPASQHPLYADALQQAFDQRGIQDDRTRGLVAVFRNAELNVQNTAAAIDAYQSQIDSGGPGSAMAEIYSQGLKEQLKGFASDEAKAEADVQRALLNFSVPMPPAPPPDLPAVQPSAAARSGASHAGQL